MVALREAGYLDPFNGGSQMAGILEGKAALITGAGSGIGLWLCMKAEIAQMLKHRS